MSVILDKIEKIREKLDSVNVDVKSLVDEAYQKGYVDKTNFDEISKKLAKDAYQKGFADAWEAARKIVLSPDDGGLSVYDESKIFGNDYSSYIFKKYSASEVIEKLKEYEEQKNDNEIKVGDEVESLYDDRTVVENTIPWIVTKIREGYKGKKSYYGIDAEGTLRNNDFVRKTGRHFDIDKILKQMKAEEDFSDF